MEEDSEEDQLARILAEVDLLPYLPRIKNGLNATKISHFDFVKREDLEQIGMSRPAARRLLAAVKSHRRKSQPFPQYPFRSLMQLIHPRSRGTDVVRQQSSSYGTSHSHPSHAVDYLNLSVERSCLIARNEISLEMKLGEGTFGEVWKGEWRRQNGSSKSVAVKMLRNNTLDLPGAFSDFVKEVEVMVGIHHPNLVQLYGVSLSSPYMIVQELAPLGSVLDRLRKEASLSSVLQIFEWSRQIVAGMAYLESRRLVHRDLAARNVFLVTAEKVKIGDFGLMKSINQDADCYTMTERKQIPFPWCAPESLKLRQFSSQSDVWAFGVTLWELFTFGEHPWAGLNGAQILQAIDEEGRRLSKPKACPSELYTIMLNCWAHRRQDRPTFKILSEYYSTVYLEEMHVISSCSDDGCLLANKDDVLVVIDGKAENNWWVCQNLRSYQIGRIARRNLEPVSRKKGSSDISRPLRNSFIHAGHGDLDQSKSFGNPVAIDDLYLRNPVQPVDLLIDFNDSSPQPIENKLHNPQQLPANFVPESWDSPAQSVSLPRRNSWSGPSKQPSVMYSNDLIGLEHSDHSQPSYFNLPPGGSSIPASYHVDLLTSPRPVASAPLYYAFPDSNVATNVRPSFPSVQYQYSNVPFTSTTSSSVYQNLGPGSTATGFDSAFIDQYPNPPMITNAQAQLPIYSNMTPNAAQANSKSAAPPVVQSAAKQVIAPAAIASQSALLPKPPRGKFPKNERVIQTVPIPSLYDFADSWGSSAGQQKAASKEIAVISPFRVEQSKAEPVTEMPGQRSVLDDLATALMRELPGESVSDCQNALKKSHFDLPKSVQYLKVQKLARLNVLSEGDCRKILEANEWNVERAGEAMINRMK